MTLVVTPDGWIQGLGLQETQGLLDLSAVRFCIGVRHRGGGSALVDLD